jgi:hypothetical protein
MMTALLKIKATYEEYEAVTPRDLYLVAVRALNSAGILEGVAAVNR